MDAELNFSVPTSASASTLSSKDRVELFLDFCALSPLTEVFLSAEAYSQLLAHFDQHFEQGRQSSLAEKTECTP